VKGAILRNTLRTLAAAVLIGFACSSAASASANADVDSYGDYLSAKLAASQHDLSEAARLYRSSLDADPNNADLLNHAFLYTAAAGDIDQASKFAARIVQASPDDRPARLALAVEALKQGDFAGARMQIAQSAKGPFTALTLSLLDAWAAQGAGDTKQALTDLKDVVGQGGTEALAAYHRALVLDLAGQNADAETAYKDALAAGANSPRMVEAYGRFLERTGRADDARAFYVKLSGSGTTAPVAAIGLVRLNSGKKPERLVASAADGAAEALFSIAASLTDQTSADIAILYLRLALYLSPDLDLAKIVLADRFEAVQKYDDAIAVYRSVDRDSPYGMAAAVQVAVDETKLDQNDKAISDLKSLTRSVPDDVDAWTALGDAYRDADRFAEAADAYDHAVKLETPASAKDWPLYYARGVSEERAKHWDAAEADLLQALKLSPDQATVLNYLGYSWVDQGRHLPEAIAMLEKARALSPFDGYIIDSVGWAYFRIGRYADAAKTLQQAVLLVPGDPTINEHLGDAYWMIGRKLDAHFQWSHALAFGPDADQKTELEAKLANGLDAGGAHS
jgi:tetratricopeptide (TPR) repeat protein